MAAAEKHIGHAQCPLCGSKRANLGLSAKQLAYLTCNNCNSQVFARSDRSDTALRALLVREPAPAPFAHPIDPVPAPVPVPQEKPAAPAPPKRPSWGMLRT